jgi:hypothetical protein
MQSSAPHLSFKIQVTRALIQTKISTIFTHSPPGKGRYCAAGIVEFFTLMADVDPAVDSPEFLCIQEGLLTYFKEVIEDHCRITPHSDHHIENAQVRSAIQMAVFYRNYAVDKENLYPFEPNYANSRSGNLCVSHAIDKRSVRLLQKRILRVWSNSIYMREVPYLHATFSALPLVNDLYINKFILQCKQMETSSSLKLFFQPCADSDMLKILHHIANKVTDKELTKQINFLALYFDFRHASNERLIALAKMNYLPAVYALTRDHIENKRFYLFSQPKVCSGLYLATTLMLLISKNKLTTDLNKYQILSVNQLQRMQQYALQFINSQAQQGRPQDALLAKWYLLVIDSAKKMLSDDWSPIDFIDVAIKNKNDYMLEGERLNSVIHDYVMQGIKESLGTVPVSTSVENTNLISSKLEEVFQFNGFNTLMVMPAMATQPVTTSRFSL